MTLRKGQEDGVGYASENMLVHSCVQKEINRIEFEEEIQ